MRVPVYDEDGKTQKRDAQGQPEFRDETGGEIWQRLWAVAAKMAASVDAAVAERGRSDQDWLMLILAVIKRTSAGPEIEAQQKAAEEEAAKKAAEVIEAKRLADEAAERARQPAPVPEVGNF